MRTSRRALCALSIALASLLALSCDNSYGIFASVQDEIKQEGTAVFQKTQVKGAFRLGTTYYAATQSLNARSVGSKGWSAIDVGGTSSYRLRSAVLAGSTMYALIETGDLASPTISVQASIDGSSWTAIAILPSPALAPTQTFSLDALFSANGVLYAEGHLYDTSSKPETSSDYALYRLVVASLDNPVTNFSLSAAWNNMTIRGVAHDGSDYWFASEDKLYRGTLADGSNATPVDTTTVFAGLFSTTDSTTRSIWSLSHTGSNLYVSTKGGTLYRYSGTGNADKASVASIPLTEVVEVPSVSVSATELLVGTDTGAGTAVGYYEGAFGSLVLGSSGAVTGNASIYSTTLSAFPAHGFYYDDLARTVFVCISPGTASTKYYGLYSSAWDSVAKTWSGWQAE